MVFTAAALRARHARGIYLVDERKVYHLVRVNDDQSALAGQLEARPGQTAPLPHRSTRCGHGPAQRRLVQAVTEDGRLFSDACQMLRIQRTHRGRFPRKWQTQTAYATTEPAVEQVSTNNIVGRAYGDWTIDNSVYRMWGFTFGEGATASSAPAVSSLSWSLVVSAAASFASPPAPTPVDAAAFALR